MSDLILNQIIQGDCLEVMADWPDGCVDLVVTSPPYGHVRDYNGFEVDIYAVIEQIARLLKQGGCCVWNEADQVVNGSETGASFSHALHAKSLGLLLHDTMIYCKEGVTFPDANRYHPAFEYMFVLSKGKPKYFNGIRDWKNKWGGSAMHGTDRQPDGTTTPIKGIKHNRKVSEYGLRRNWWVISNPYTGETSGHPAPMPKQMAHDHIVTWCEDGDLVVDPLCGSGTTCVAAKMLGRNYIGIDISEEYCQIARDRLKALDTGVPVAEAKAGQMGLFP